MAVLINDWGSPGSSLSIDGRGLFAWREQGRKIPGNFSNLLICLVVCSATCKKYALKEAIWNTQHNKSMVIPLILCDVVASCQFPISCIVQQTIIQNISFFPSEYKYLCGPSTCKVIALDLFCTVGAGRRPLNTSLALSNLPTLCQPWPCALLRPSPHLLQACGILRCFCGCVCTVHTWYLFLRTCRILGSKYLH